MLLNIWAFILLAWGPIVWSSFGEQFRTIQEVWRTHTLHQAHRDILQWVLPTAALMLSVTLSKWPSVEKGSVFSTKKTLGSLMPPLLIHLVTFVSLSPELCCSRKVQLPGTKSGVAWQDFTPRVVTASFRVGTLTTVLLPTWWFCVLVSRWRDAEDVEDRR